MIIVFGASILSDQLLSIPKKFSLNLHTGLTQYYRGVDSHFWPIFDNRPECIGVTIHSIDSSIDGGNILIQKRFQLNPDDSLHQIFFKSVVKGFQAFEEGLRSFLKGDRHFEPQQNPGKLFCVKDFSEEYLLSVNK